MNFPRRQFLRTGAAALLGTAVTARAQTPPMLASALAAAGFQPGAPGHALLAVVADLHIDLNPGTTLTEFDTALVNELNSLTGLTDMVLAGDIITSHSNAAGQPRYPNAYANAREEFRIAKRQMNRFSGAYRLWAVPGNHDSDNQEITPDLWNQELGIAPYRRLNLGGVPVFLLNSGHAGTLDPVQKTWFLSQVAGIPRNQEVLIVAHHPSFFYMVGETGLKKIVAETFAGWQAPVYLIGGHGHANAHRIASHRGARFLQMQVTCADRTQWSDGNAAGYGLVALAGGRVLTRIFRSVSRNTMQNAPTEAIVPATRLEWPFDYVPFPARTWETDGLRHGLVSFLANDLRTHFSYVGNMEWSFDMSPYGGKIREFLLLASISSGVIGTTKVSFAAGGPSPTWVDRTPGPPDAGLVHRIPIPESLRSASVLRIRFSTSLPQYGGSITIGGWGFGSDHTALTGYERWCAVHYRTFLATPETAPDRLPPGQTLSNLELFAFNHPVPETAEPGLWTLVGGGESIVPQPPTLGFAVETVHDFIFRRRKLPATSGLVYTVQVSKDLVNWSTVPESGMMIDPLDSESWERVTVRRTSTSSRLWYFRVGVQPVPGGGGAYAAWRSSLPASLASPNDRNGNGRPDLFEFAFDTSLPPSLARASSHSSPEGSDFLPPSLSTSRARLPILRFTRMKESARPGIRYVLESTENMRDWKEYPAGLQDERLVAEDGDYETVEIACVDVRARSRFYRVRVQTSGR